MNQFYEINQDELHAINGGSVNGVLAELGGAGLALVGTAIVCSTAPVSVPVMVAGGIALVTGTAAANIGYWETRGWIKW